ncbi:MAG: serine hydrolase domain-containing protein [Acidovorax sp.]|nr:serine hydrolase domain-containing protein [Acidovorax sp.]
MSLQAELDRIVDTEHGRDDVHEVALGVLDAETWTHACRGNWQGQPVGPDTPFLIASTSKLLVTAMLLQLVGEGHLALDDSLGRFFAPGELDRLHLWKGTDFTSRITLRHLLTHTSGLPDYFEGKRRDGSTLAVRLFEGHDQAFGLAEVLAWTRDEMHPSFPPGTGMKALYSDTNFHLLTEVIVRSRGQDIDKALASRIAHPLGLKSTAFYKPGMGALPLRYGSRVVEIPFALSSMPGDGGAVSCLEDLARFTSAFFSGALFPRAMLEELAPWRRIFFPLQTGTGVLRFAVPRWLPPFRQGLEFIGHSGITGTLAFACPPRGRIIVANVNQLQGRSRPYKMMIKAALA